jgi:hypothetical protein
VHRRVQLLVGVGLGLGGHRGPRQVRALDPSAAEVTGRQVHDRPTQVGAEGARVAQVPQSPDELRERLLDEVIPTSTARSVRSSSQSIRMTWTAASRLRVHRLRS